MIRLAFLLALLPFAAAAVDQEALLAKRPAKWLSAYGLFADAAAQIPAKGVTPYDLATPLFSDHAEKLRFVWTPSPARYVADEAFEFPVGSVLIKTFAYPRGAGLIETRLLIRQEAGWKAWPYVWDAAKGDAQLKLAGARFDVSHEGQTISYRVPNANQCKGCHMRDGGIVPIGPKARNLNHEFAYSDGTRNQLSEWIDRGHLDAAPQPPASANWRAGDLADRARAYLDVNCAHCHRRDGPASNSGLFLTYGEDDRTAWGYRKRPVAAGRGSGGLEFDIAPGDPEGSIMVHRMQSLDPGVSMPELGRSLPHPEGIALISEWIAEMD